MAIELSVCLIVKNEEEYLANCLDCVKDFADEIVIVDTGSIDKTIEIASMYTDKIYLFEWINDFAAARNFSFSKATREYIMWLDADDIIDSENINKIKMLKKEITEDISFIRMLYHTEFEKIGKPIIVINRERIVKRSCGFLWHRPIHEALDVRGKCIESDIFIIHASKKANKSMERNLLILEEMFKRDNSANILDLFYYARTLANLMRTEEAVKYLLLITDKKNIQTPVYCDACIILGQIYFDKEEKDKLYDLLNEKAILLMDSSEIFCLLGDYYRFFYDDTKKAIYYYENALSKKGEERLFRTETFYYYYPHLSLGQCYQGLCDYENAMIHYQKALSFNPDDEQLITTIYKLKKIIRLESKLASKT